MSFSWKEQLMFSETKGEEEKRQAWTKEAYPYLDTAMKCIFAGGVTAFATIWAVAVLLNIPGIENVLFCVFVGTIATMLSPYMLVMHEFERHNPEIVAEERERTKVLFDDHPAIGIMRFGLLITFVIAGMFSIMVGKREDPYYTTVMLTLLLVGFAGHMIIERKVRALNRGHAITKALGLEKVA